MVSRLPEQSRSPGRAGATSFGALLALALLAVLFPWFPGQPRLEEGATASATITAPRSHSYDSAVETEIRRAQAAAAVPDVLVLDPGIRDRQLALLDRQLAAIEDARRDSPLSASARESAIRAMEGVSLSRRGAAVFATATDAEWTALGDELRSGLEQTLSVAINEEDLPAARQRLREVLPPRLSSDQALALGELADSLIVATQVVDEAGTDDLRRQARALQPAVRVSIASGQVIVADGQRLTAAGIERLDELGLRATGVQATRVAATALLAAMVAAACGGYLFVVRPRSLVSLRRLTLFALLLLIPTVAAKFSFPLLLPDADRLFLAYAVPLAAAPIAAAVLLDIGAALLLTIVLASVTAFVTVYVPDAGLTGAAAQLEAVQMWLAVASGSLAGVYFAARAERLQRYLAAGIAVALAVASALLVFWLLDADRRALELLWIAGSASAGGLLAALIAVGALVLLSRPFGIITRWELMELAQFNHRLLRRLQDEAPGTFQHSVLVGNLAERAADRIGANALLVRVGAYYHDVGKLVAPEFFVENFTSDDDPHQVLDPLQSTRVIQQHVSGGVEIARRERLPEAVVQFVPQHHGTRLVSFFYRRAAAVDADIDPELFRYPGPKPQTREAALVMLADACEAIVRSTSDRSAERIGEIVEGVIKERIEEAELDDCDISLRDLRVVSDSFTSALTAIYHPRVEYPEPTERELAERSGAPPPPDGEPASPDGGRALSPPPASGAPSPGAAPAAGQPGPSAEDDA